MLDTLVTKTKKSLTLVGNMKNNNKIGMKMRIITWYGDWVRSSTFIIIASDKDHQYYINVLMVSHLMHSLTILFCTIS